MGVHREEKGGGKVVQGVCESHPSQNLREMRGQVGNGGESDIKLKQMKTLNAT